jgi:UDP-hydrolysing UDP-N-acetyl-D-glucosamine 2-epimerase
MKKRKILILTERRADYSRFKPILKKLQNNKIFKYFILVTGTHLIKEHGLTIKEIYKDNFKIFCKFENFKNNKNNKIDDAANMIFAMGKTFLKLAKIIKKIEPNIILSGFDIGANFALTVAGAHFNIPIAHIQGGEITGSIDESLRHAMSKFANYHLVSNSDAKKRLIKMGEKAKNIFVVGCPSLDALLEEPITKDSILEKKFNLDLSKKILIVIQHPVTTENEKSREQIAQTIAAIKKSRIQTLFVMPNNDYGHKSIIKQIKKNNLNCTKTLSLSEYKSLLLKSSILIGNSSSGIHEAALFKVPVINLGNRQSGRLKPINVINAKHNSSDIFNKINYCLNNKNYIKKIKNTKSLYGNGGSAKKIINILKKINLNQSTQKINTY